MFYFDPPPALKAPTGMASIHFEVTSACNLQCVGCGRTTKTAKGTWVNKHMAKADFAKIIEHLPPVGTATLQGIGEPTINPDFIDMLRMARESGKFREIVFVTNALVRDADYYVEASKYADHFIVSVDTLNPHYVAGTRAGTDTEKLKEMIGGLLARKLNFQINMVVSRYNVADVPSSLKILNDLGPLMVRFIAFESVDGNLPDYPLSEDEYRTLGEVLEKLKIFLPNLTWAFSPITEVEPDNRSLCGVGAPALAPYVTAQGHVTPCCRINSASPWEKASLIEHSFAEIWASPVVRRYVHHFMEKGDPRCAGCPQSGRVPVTEEQSESDFHLSLERILVPSVNFLLRLNQREEAVVLTRSFLRTVLKAEGGHPLNKSQTYYRIAILLEQLGQRDEARGVLDEIIALIGPNAQVETLRSVLTPEVVPA